MLLCYTACCSVKDSTAAEYNIVLAPMAVCIPDVLPIDSLLP